MVRQTVARWVQQYRAQGKSVLRKASRAGRKPRWSEKQQRQLEKLLLAGSERLGYETPLWTCPRVAHLIEQEFAVRYHEGHVWKIPVGLGRSPQRRIRRGTVFRSRSSTYAPNNGYQSTGTPTRPANSASLYFE